jgi:hypothetical protein
MTGKIHTIGTRAQVWHGTSKKTSGGLTKSDLMMNKAGRIVSRAKHNSAKKEMRLLKYGYGTQKGKFGFVKVGSKSRKSRKGSKKMRGGMPSLSPSQANWAGDGIDGQGITQGQNGGPGGPLTAALMAGGRRRSRRMYGGSGMSPLGSAGSANWAGDGIDGQGITQGQNGGPGGPLTAALMAGGKRRRSRGQSRSRRQGRGQGMMGGTSQPMPYLNPANPENLALGAAS